MSGRCLTILIAKMFRYGIILIKYQGSNNENVMRQDMFGIKQPRRAEHCNILETIWKPLEDPANYSQGIRPPGAGYSRRYSNFT